MCLLLRVLLMRVVLLRVLLLRVLLMRVLLLRVFVVACTVVACVCCCVCLLLRVLLLRVFVDACGVVVCVCCCVCLLLRVFVVACLPLCRAFVCVVFARASVGASPAETQRKGPGCRPAPADGASPRWRLPEPILESGYTSSSTNTTPQAGHVDAGFRGESAPANMKSACSRSMPMSLRTQRRPSAPHGRQEIKTAQPAWRERSERQRKAEKGPQAKALSSRGKAVDEGEAVP